MPPSNSNILSVTEALRRFHKRWAGTGGDVFGQAHLPTGETTYAWLTEPLRRGPVLDIGCGAGEALALLKVPGVGIEVNEAELERARQRALPNIELVSGDARELPFTDSRFEHVISHMALMLIPDPEQVASEIDRVLAPGGTLRLVIGRKSNTQLPSVSAFLLGLRKILSEHGPRIDFPSSSWIGDDLAARLPGWEVNEEVLDVTARIPVADLPTYLRISFYNSGLIEGAGSEALDGLIASVAEEHAVDGSLLWGISMKGVVARKPF